MRRVWEKQVLMGDLWWIPLVAAALSLAYVMLMTRMQRRQWEEDLQIEIIKFATDVSCKCGREACRCTGMCRCPEGCDCAACTVVNIRR